MAKTEKKFEEKVFHTILEQDNEKGGGTVLRVMAWVVDGKEMKPTIDKREWWMTEEGEKRVGKAKGISAYDLLAILRDIKNIAKHLKVPAEDIKIALEMEQKPVAKEAATSHSGDPWG